ncbi:hypothetical protein DN31_1417 [Vibrio mimicus]|nr:hypothetical protein DN31_1417 [Vibrio mimicus]
MFKKSRSFDTDRNILLALIYLRIHASTFFPFA